jgi:hypothetical protein
MAWYSTRLAAGEVDIKMSLFFPKKDYTFHHSVSEQEKNVSKVLEKKRLKVDLNNIGNPLSTHGTFE